MQIPVGSKTCEILDCNGDLINFPTSVESIQCILCGGSCFKKNVILVSVAVGRNVNMEMCFLLIVVDLRLLLTGVSRPVVQVFAVICV